MKNYLTDCRKRESSLLDSPFPLEVIHIGEPANNMDMFHWHEYMEISYIQEGRGTYEIEDKVFHIKKGDIVIINGIEKHRVTYGPGETLYETVIHFDSRLIYSIINNPRDHSYLKLFSRGADFVNRPELDAGEKELITGIISDIVNEYVQRKSYFELVIKSRLLLLIALLLRQRGTRPPDEVGLTAKRKNISLLEKILKYSNENFKTDLSMDRVARRFYMNASYFSEFFKKNIGINYTEYLTRLRINEAIRLLNESGLSTTEISYACGFNNMSSFYNAFKKITGTNPGNYMKRGSCQ